MADETRTLAWQLVVETKGIEQNTAKASSALGDLSKGFKFLQGTIAAIAASQVARMFVDLSDTLTKVQNDIRQVTNSTAEFDATQRALMVSARGTGTSIETAAANYRALRVSLDGYTVTARQVLTLSDTITKAVKLQGGSAQDAEAAVKRLAYAFEQGTVSTRDLNQMVRQSPALYKALAAAMPDKDLARLAAQGKLTGEMLLEGLGGAADSIAEKFKNRVTPLGEAFTNVKTSVVSVFAEFDKATGLTDALAKGISAYADALAEFPTNIKAFIINVREFIELTSLEIVTFFRTAANDIRKWIADLGTAVASAIPDWVPGAAKAKQFFTDVSRMSVQSNESIKLSHDIARAATEDRFARERLALNDAQDDWRALEITVNGTGKSVGQSLEAFKAFEKALASLQSEYNKIKDRAAAVTVEIRDGAQASKEYTLAAEARRRVEEQIAGMDLAPGQAEQLIAQAKANADAAISAERYANAWSLVKGAIDEGTTSQEKAADQLKVLEAGFELVRAKMSDEQIRRYNVRLAELREAADPAAASLKRIKEWADEANDTIEKYAISNQAMIVSLQSGTAAGRAYTNAAEAELAVRQKIQEAIDKKQPLSAAEIDSYRKTQQAIADAKTANADLADAQRLVDNAIQAGMTDREKTQQQIDAVTDAVERLRGSLSEDKMRAAELGLQRMKDQASQLGKTLEEAAYKAGEAFVNFVIDGQQSFSEFAASVIKDIGRMIAQLYMQMAVEMMIRAIRGYAKGGVFDRGRELAFQHGGVVGGHGGVVGGPVEFPLARGMRGVMGEAGPEAVMPLARLPGGDLGVKTQPMNLELINNTGVNATARVKSESDRTQLILEAAELGATWAQSRFNSSVNSGYGASATSLQRTYGLTRRKA